jgi:hypothetical protein
MPLRIHPQPASRGDIFMKKNLKKLTLNKETLNKLTQPMLKEALGGLQMGDGIVDTGCDSACTQC